MPQLVYQDGSGVEKTLELNQTTVFIGRANDCQIQSEDPRVSRRHARLVWNGAYFIEDLGSANGTIVRNQKVQRVALRTGDTFQCGSIQFRFVDETATAPSPIVQAAQAPRKTPVLGMPAPELPPRPASSAPRPMPSSVPAAIVSSPEPPASFETPPLGSGTNKTPPLPPEVVNSPSVSRVMAAATPEATKNLRTELEQERKYRMELEVQVKNLTVRVESLEKPLPEVDDILAELRISLRAATDESSLLTAPPEAAQLIQESLRHMSELLEQARTKLKLATSKLE